MLSPLSRECFFPRRFAAVSAEFARVLRMPLSNYWSSVAITVCTSSAPVQAEEHPWMWTCLVLLFVTMRKDEMCPVLCLFLRVSVLTNNFSCKGYLVWSHTGRCNV